MTREDLEAYIHNQFDDTTTNTPWTQFPHYKVFRHQENRKWFALIMNITTDKLGWSKIKPIDVLNIKCEPTMIGAFRKEPGIYAAYHMDKAHWLTISLDGSVPTERIKMLLDMSYRLTK